MVEVGGGLLVVIPIGALVGLVSGLCLLPFIRVVDDKVRAGSPITGTDLVGSSPGLFVIPSSMFIPKLILSAEQAATGFGYYAASVVFVAFVIVVAPTYALIQNTSRYLGRR